MKNHNPMPIFLLFAGLLSASFTVPRGILTYPESSVMLVQESHYMILHTPIINGDPRKVYMATIQYPGSEDCYISSFTSNAKKEFAAYLQAEYNVPPRGEGYNMMWEVQVVSDNNVNTRQKADSKRNELVNEAKRNGHTPVQTGWTYSCE